MHSNPRTILFVALASLFSVAVGLTIVRAADDAKSDTSDDEKALQGSWIIESAEFKATQSPDPVGGKFTFAAGKVTLQRSDKEPPKQFAYALRSSTVPREIELTSLDDSGKPDPTKTVRGIYRVEANTLRLCMNDRPGPEPTAGDFKTDKYSNDVLLVLKRQK